MKKIYLTLVAVIAMIQVPFAQWTTSTPNIYNNNTGNVGIGTATPIQTLDVWGTGLLFHSILGNHSETLIRDGSIEDPANANDNGGVIFNYEGYNGFSYYRNLTIFNGKGSEIAQFVGATGNFLIGEATQINSFYKLDVGGAIRANSIVVNNTGADFVFEPSYKLIPLPTLEEYIIRNRHLPEIASAKEMQTNGVDLGQNQVKLLQKVEELTLYLIEKDKQLTDEKADIITLKHQNDLKDASINQLSDQLKSQQAQLDLLIKQMALITNEKSK